MSTPQEILNRDQETYRANADYLNSHQSYDYLQKTGFQEVIFDDLLVMYSKGRFIADYHCFFGGTSLKQFIPLYKEWVTYANDNLDVRILRTLSDPRLAKVLQRYFPDKVTYRGRELLLDIK